MKLHTSSLSTISLRSTLSWPPTTSCPAGNCFLFTSARSPSSHSPFPGPEDANILATLTGTSFLTNFMINLLLKVSQAWMLTQISSTGMLSSLASRMMSRRAGPKSSHKVARVARRTPQRRMPRRTKRR